MRQDVPRHALSRRLPTVLRRARLIVPGDRVLIAVSGGPDSVSLLALLAELAPVWQLGLWVAHINHGLRGAESAEDERFVRQLCDQLSIPLTVESAPLAVSAKLRGGRSLQETAREARYTTLRQIGNLLGTTKTALGHTADDQAETILLWMLRGAGSRGLAGMPQTREGLFIRPLLEFQRAEIISYLEARGLPYRMDSSNANRAYLRTRVRHDLLPILRQLNPEIVEVLRRQADLLREEDRWLEARTATHERRLTTTLEHGDIVLPRDGLLALPLALQRRLIRRLVRRVSGAERGPGFRTIDATLDHIAHGSSGVELVLRGVRVAREYDTLWFRPCLFQDSVQPVAGQVPASGLPLPVPSTLRWPLTSQVIEVSSRNATVRDRSSHPGSGARRVLLDLDRVTPDLHVRSWQAGDAFQPLGMDGRRKKLQDFFSDLKVPRHRRSSVPLLVSPEGILWVVGFRADHRFRPRPGTRKVLVVALQENSS